jgi:Ni,Fe-hydrogenase III small subunit
MSARTAVLLLVAYAVALDAAYILNAWANATPATRAAVAAGLCGGRR